MNIKLSCLTGLGLALFFSASVINPAKASSVKENNVSSFDSVSNQFESASSELDLQLPKNSLISQLAGHDLYKGEGTIGCGLLIGHVVATVGNIGFIVLPDPDDFNLDGDYLDHVHLEIDAYDGDDVLIRRVEDDEGNYYYEYEGIAHSPWTIALITDYGVRDLRSEYICGSYVSLLERTAPLWAQLETRETVVSPPPQTTPTYTPVESPQPEPPVRGLW
jgi:hypothetical protein